MSTLNFKGSNPGGFRAEIRKSSDPYDHGFSVFTWRDDGCGVILWRERHELDWSEALAIASDWLKHGVSA